MKIREMALIITIIITIIKAGPTTGFLKWGWGEGVGAKRLNGPKVCNPSRGADT